MSYGIEVRNQNYDILIDGNFQNYSLHQKFTGSWVTRYMDAPTGTARGRLSHRDLGFRVALMTNEPPIICAVGVGRYVAAAPLGKPGNWAGIRLIASLDEGEGTVDFIAHAYAPSRLADFSSGDAYGIQVFRGDGSLVFDSRKYPIRIAGQATLPQIQYTDNDGDHFLGSNVLPDIQLFRGIRYLYTDRYGGNSVTDWEYLNRICAKRVGSNTYWSQKMTGYDSTTATGGLPGYAASSDALIDLGDEGYDLAPGSSGARVPYCLIRETPF